MDELAEKVRLADQELTAIDLLIERRDAVARYVSELLHDMVQEANRVRNLQKGRKTFYSEFPYVYVTDRETGEKYKTLELPSKIPN